MRLTTFDLFNESLCPMRARLDPPVQEESSPARELVRRVFLLKAIGRETGWTPKGIANAWDEIFWSGKEMNRVNMDASVRGVLSARALYRNLPKDGFSVHSTKNLSTMIDSSVELSSSGDFLLEYPDRYETWIYKRWNHKQARRSILPLAEHFLFQRGAKEDKPFFLTFYYVNTNRMTPINFRIASTHSENYNSKIITHLCDQVRKGISYPVGGEHCSGCEINC